MKNIKHTKVSAKVNSADTSLIRPVDWNAAHDEQIPEALSELTDDATHRTVTDTEKGTWNGKAEPGDIPTALSELSDDTTHRLVTDTEKGTWNGKQSALGFSPEDVSNKITTWGSPTDAQYPSAKLSKDTLDLKIPKTVATDTNFTTGFVNRTQSTLSFDNGTLTFSITRTGASYDIYSAGEKIVISATKTKAITNVAGLHYIYFDNTGTLQESTSPWDITGPNIPVAIIFWNGASGRIWEERHGANRNPAWHKWAHDTIRTTYETGLDVTFTNTTISVTSGSIHDEDIEHNITGPVTACLIVYRTNGGGSLTFDAAPVTTPYRQSAGVLQYDDGDGTPANIGNNNYVTSWIWATSDAVTPLYCIMGRGNHNTIALARAETVPSIPISTAEWKLIYRAIYRNVGGTATYIEHADYRLAAVVPLAGGPAPTQPLAANVVTDTTNFNGILSGADTTVQAALDTIDDAAVPYTGAKSDVDLGAHDLSVEKVTAKGDTSISTAFTGAGLNDAVIAGQYRGGDDASFTVEIDSAGSLYQISVHTPGTGYTVAFDGTFVQAGGSGGTIRCIINMGGVGSVELKLYGDISEAGNGYHAENGIAIIGGGGTGAKFNILSVRDTFKYYRNSDPLKWETRQNLITASPVELLTIGDPSTGGFTGLTVVFENMLGHTKGNKWVASITVQDMLVGKDDANNFMAKIQNNGVILSSGFGKQLVITTDNYYMESAPVGVRYFVFQPPTDDGVYVWETYLPDPGKFNVNNRFKEIWVINRTVSQRQTLTLGLNKDAVLLGGGGRIITPSGAQRGSRLILNQGQSMALVSTLYILGVGSFTCYRYKWCWQVTMATEPPVT